MDSNDHKINTPTIFVILGATGDLGKKKLLPALHDLYIKDLLPDIFHVFAFSRAPYEDESFRDYVKETINSQRDEYHKAKLESLVSKISYIRGDFENRKDYARLKSEIDAESQKLKVCTNKIFHLAVPPNLVEGIIENLASEGLTDDCSDEFGWTRVLVEKPFGKDLDTARSLDEKLAQLFKEVQIFRIDHYLAKQTIQNILFFRFSNLIFDPVWNNGYIESVCIRLLERDDIGTRGRFYDGVGALRDVGQNHLLQMLSIIAMENPASLESSLVRYERAKTIKALKVFDKDAIRDDVIRGQYRGYRQTEGVDDGSSTETYFKIKAQVDNDRWRGVPFYLESGKALSEKKTDITIDFKQVKPCLCPIKDQGHSHKNRITFSIQPEEGIYIRFWAKKQGAEKKIEPRDLSFDYKPGSSLSISDYESVMLDCMKGDQMLFASTEEIQASWQFITPIIRDWSDTRLYIYEKGSDGPKGHL